MTESPIFGVPTISRADRSDGTVILESSVALARYETNLVYLLRRWAEIDADHVLIAERVADGQWDRWTYGRVLTAANAIGQSLLDRGLGRSRPLLILSANSVGHLLVTLGAMTVGIPVAPISVAYSLQVKNFSRLRAITRMLEPGGIYVEDAAQFEAAAAACGSPEVLISRRHGPSEHDLDMLLATAPAESVDHAHSALDAGDVAKILFTSGSTGDPKGVVTTHRMLCANQQMMRQIWPFLQRERPVLVDWLPWSHTFGGSHNVGMVLANGGTMYIDEGRPVPGRFQMSLENYRDVPPTIAFNVPAGYAQLVPALEADLEFAERYFSRLRVVFNAAAALPAPLRDRLAALTRDVAGRDIPVTGSWGTTETAPAATSAHFDYTDARCIGVPLPGVTLKLVPDQQGTSELRVRGPIVTSGYLKNPNLTEAAFDEEGFYRSGDSVMLADPADPAAGLLFVGRLAEDFKLSTGTFVRVGALRSALLACARIIADAVIGGEGRDQIVALAWLNPAEVERVLDEPLPSGNPLEVSDRLRSHLGAALAALNADAGSAGRISRLAILLEPASIERGEITDKGYVNQRRVLTERQEVLQRLYEDPLAAEVIVPATGPERT